MIDNQFLRSGIVRPTQKVKRSQEMAEYLVNKVHSMGENCRFDMLHNSGGEYAVHEFCSALGGVALRYLDAKTHVKCIDYALKHGSSTNRLFSKELRDNEQNDKYELRDYFRSFDRVIFLPGSNIMHTNIDMTLVENAMTENAVIKPHPITNSGDINWLQTTFGKDNVLPAKVKGAELIKNCKRAYMAKNSELWFLAIAFGCGVTDIGSNYGGDAYRPVIDVITQNHVFQPVPAMNRIFGSCYSGIYFSYEEIDANVEKYIELSRRFKC